MVADAAEPRIGVREIAAAVGRTPRLISVWFGQGCPHVREGDGPKARQTARLSDVRAWMRERGLDTRKKRMTAEEVAARDAGQVTIAESVDRLVQERAAELVGDVPFGAMLIKARIAFEQLTKAAAGQLTIAEARDTAQSLKHVSGEIRQLEQSKWDAERRLTQWVRRADAVRVITDLVEMVKADMAAIREEAAAKVAAAAEGVDAGSVGRVAAVTVRAVIDKKLADRANAIDDALRRLEAAASAAAIAA